MGSLAQCLTGLHNLSSLSPRPFQEGSVAEIKGISGTPSSSTAVLDPYASWASLLRPHPPAASLLPVPAPSPSISLGGVRSQVLLLAAVNALLLLGVGGTLFMRSRRRDQEKQKKEEERRADRDAGISRIGSLAVTRRVLGYGSHGTVVFEVVQCTLSSVPSCS